MHLSDILNYTLLEFSNYTLSISNIVFVVLIAAGAKLFLFLLRKALEQRKNLDPGRRHSLMLISRYFIWVIAIGVGLEALGISLTIFVAGSAALFVGIGFGLQQLFNDLVSGIFLLFEGSIEVNDILEVDGVVGRVRSINLRTSTLLTRDDTVIIVPNHKFVSEKVVNWSHNFKNTRFKVGVGVAYGSDTSLVRDLLLQAAQEQKGVSQSPNPFVRFADFGDSSLDFKLYIWSEDPFAIDEVLSQLRFRIDQLFRENGVQIPFPQRDLHIKSSVPIR